MRHLTEDQLVAAKQRRERFRNFVQKVGKMTDEERQAFAAKVPALATCEGHIFSGFNHVLILTQANGTMPSILGGFRQWRKQGRTVKKGEHGYMIWVPCIPKAKEGEEERITDDDLRFIMGTVFDISQTQELGQETAEAGA